jgi:hypothetical protein
MPLDAYPPGHFHGRVVAVGSTQQVPACPVLQGRCGRYLPEAVLLCCPLGSASSAKKTTPAKNEVVGWGWGVVF